MSGSLNSMLLSCDKPSRTAQRPALQTSAGASARDLVHKPARGAPRDRRRRTALFASGTSSVAGSDAGYGTRAPRSTARRRPEDRELVGDLEAPRAEAEDRGRPAAAAAGGAALARRLDHAPAQQYALEVCRRDVVPEGGGVELAELGDRELRGREGEADVRVRELCPQALAARERDLAMIERQLGQGRDGMPGRVIREPGIQARRDEAEVRRGDLPFARISSGVAERLQLLEVGDLAHVDLCGEVLADGLLKRFAGLEVTARK